MTFGVVCLPYHTHTGKEKDYKELKHKNLEEHLIHRFHYVADLRWLFFLILHNLCFISHVNRNTVEVVTVAKCSPTQAQLLDVDCEYFFKLGRLDIGIPFLEVLIRQIAVNFTVKVEYLFIR